jgi:MFS family permease
MGVSPFYWLLLLGMAVVAGSHSIWHLPAQSSLSYHFSHRRGLVLSLHGVGGSVGDVAGPVATGAILAVLSWRGLLSVYALTPLLLGVLAIWVFRHIGLVREEEATVVTLSQRAEITKQLLKSRVLWGLIMVRGLRSMTLVSLVTVLPLYLAQDLELTPFSRGVHIGLLIAIGLVAKPVAGQLSDRYGRKQVLVPGLIWSCLLTLALAVFADGILLTITVALLGLFLYPDQPILIAAVFDVVGRDVASTATGVTASIGFLMSAGSSLAAGALYETMGFQAVVFYVAALFALASVIFLALPLRRNES